MSPRPLGGKRVHVAGSIGPTTPNALAVYAHDLVRSVVKGIMTAGGGIVVGVGKEPCFENGPAQVFDWTVLEIVAQAIREGGYPKEVCKDCPVIIVVSEKGESEIPDPRKTLWTELLQSGAVEVKRILPGARSAALIRSKQVEYGSVLFILGGGTGVEHLADEYRKAYKPIIPLDLPLGAARQDGTGGAKRLAQESRANPTGFICLKRGESGREGAMLARIATENGRADFNKVASGVLDIIMNLAPPTIFYVRLLNREHAAFERVERYYRNVVDLLAEEFGLTHVDLGKDEVQSAFLNTEIFTRLHHSTVAIVDVTGARPNCFIELGYALGRGLSVICMAEKGTVLPFDQSAIPCHFWRDDLPDDQRREELRAFWLQVINRSSLVH